MILTAFGSALLVVTGLAVIDFKMAVGEEGGNSKAGLEEKTFSKQYNKVRDSKRIISLIKLKTLISIIDVSIRQLKPDLFIGKSAC